MPTAPGAAVEFRALGTGVRVLTTRPRALAAARDVVEAEIVAIDLACSRFRPDSELVRLNALGGEASISPTFVEALDAGLRAARLTAGAVDPTVGAAMRRIGYDRDFACLVADPDPGPGPLVPRAAPGWSRVELDVAARRVRVPRGVELDLGCVAKALAADRAARTAWQATGAGVLVALGGDISVAGPAPEGGWRVLVTDDHAAPLDAPGQVVSVLDGGLATSSTTVRRWLRGEVQVHHILDPANGLPAAGRWRTVSVTAASCVDANIAATASIIWGEQALGWLGRHRLPARLVEVGGGVVTVGGWPRQPREPADAAP